MIDELMLDETPEEIDSEAGLIGPDSLGLDSVDALQLVVALEKHFGLKVADEEAARTVLASVSAIATAVEAHQAGSVGS